MVKPSHPQDPCEMQAIVARGRNSGHERVVQVVVSSFDGNHPPVPSQEMPLLRRFMGDAAEKWDCTHIEVGQPFTIAHFVERRQDDDAAQP